jgi:hypothetical protein
MNDDLKDTKKKKKKKNNIKQYIWLHLFLCVPWRAKLLTSYRVKNV